MASTREIRRKIKSIKSTKQITRAMELVSASKMKKAVANAIAIRPYAVNAMMVLTHLSEKTDQNLHPFLVKRDLNNVIFVLMASDGGLCGGFNALLFKKVVTFEKEFKAEHPDCTISYVTIGKKAETFIARSGRNLIASYSNLGNNPGLKAIMPIYKLVADYYKSGETDMVVLAYQNFSSALVQKPTMKTMLPFSRENMEHLAHELNLFQYMGTEIEGNKAVEYKFEPSISFVLENLLPGLLELQLYHTLLESLASEHSARMVAMRSATDNANELIDSLTLVYNQTRQAGITREIAEISAGKVALGL